MFRAFGIWRNVICDLCLQYFPGRFFRAAPSLCFPRRCNDQWEGQISNRACLLDSKEADQVCFPWVFVPLAWSPPAGPLGGKTALRPTCFGSYFSEP